jgi:DNA-binding NarL/FixJ family response regulator
VTLRVAIVDDEHLIRSGLRMILDSTANIEVVGEAYDGDSAVELARRERPGVMLMDVRMPNVDGVEATRRIGQLEFDPLPRVLILTTFGDDENVYAALRAGASGFIVKDIPPEELIRAVRLIAEGECVLDPAVTRRFIKHFASSAVASGSASRLDALTERELDVLRLIARGLSNSEIATQLVVAETTVKTHVSHIFGKLGIRERAHAVVVAYECGLVQPGVAGTAPT